MIDKKPIIVCIAGLLSLLCLEARVDGQFKIQRKEESVQRNAFVPAPREFSRPIKRAREAIDEKKYREAAAYLGEVLAISGGQDYLGYIDTNSHLAVSLRREAQRLLGSIPHRERASYELKYGIEAKQLLNEAVADSDYAKIADIVQRYFHTPSGYTATMLLGHHHLQQGRPIAAAFAFQRILDDQRARKLHDPEASILLATCWVLGRSPEKASGILSELKSRQPSGAIEFAGKSVPMFNAGGDPLDWLAGLIGNSPLNQLAAVNQWIMYRGNPQRNANSGTGFPLRYPRWRVPTVNDPDLEQIAKDIHRELIQSDSSSIPALQTIAVNDTILFRSSSKLIGVDYRSGKRIWVFPDDMLFENTDAETFGQNSQAKSRLKTRMWMDASFGQSSSDGRSVFVLDRNKLPIPVAGQNRQVVITRGTQQTESFANILRAADIQREGAFKWEVGGVSGLDEPKLANTFFLGAPLPLDNRLYCICEVQGEIRLVVLDSDNGRMLWSQQLATSEHVGAVATNGFRQLCSATPSYSDGILICPTTANALVAVDISTKSLIWGFEYSGLVQTNRYSSLNSSNMMLPNHSWIDDSITVSHGNIVLTPVSSQYIYCLDLLTGESKWVKNKKPNSIAREDSLYVATTDENQIVLVGNKYVRGLSLKTGKENWKTALDEVGRPSGRGYFNNGFYFLPTTDSLLLKIELASGKITEKQKTQGVLGNLICYQGDVISHGIDYISVFPQVLPNRKRIANLDFNGEISDHDQILKAQLLAHDRDYAGAVELAEAVYTNRPNASNRRILMDLIIDFMREDYEKAEVVASKYHDQLQSRSIATYQTARIDGLIKTGKYDDALAIAFELAASTKDFAKMPVAAGEVLAVSRGSLLNRRFDIWFKAQIQKTLSAAPDQREELQNRIMALAADHLENVESAQLVQYTRMVGHDYFSDDALLRFARSHVEAGMPLAAEFALRNVADSSDPELRAQAEGLYCELLRQSADAEVVLAQYEQLSAKYGDVICFDGKTGTELRDAFVKTIKAAPERAPWNLGRANVKWETGKHRFDHTKREMPMVCLQADGSLSDQYQFAFNQYRKEMVVRNRSGIEIAKIPFTIEQNRNYSSGMTAIYMIHDGLLVAVYGYDVIGVDLHRLKKGRKALLWHVSTMPPEMAANASPYMAYFRMSNTTDSTWGNLDQYFTANSTGKRIGDISQIHPNGFGYMKKGSLICVDPLTGTTRWQVGGFAEDARLTNDGKHICVLEPRTKTAHVLSMSDGRSLDKSKWKTEHGTFWQKSDTGAVFSVRKGGEQILTLYDFVNKKVVWKKNHVSSSRGTVYRGQLLATLSPAGTFEICDLATGDSQSKFDYGVEKGIYGIEMVPHGDYWRVTARKSSSISAYQSKGTTYFQGIAYSIPLTHGYLHMVNRKTGKPNWKKPAFIEYFSIPDFQPTGTPVLAMARLVSTRTATSVRRVQVAGIDIRNGRELFVESYNYSSLQYCHVSQVSDKNEVFIHIDRASLNVQFNNERMPPGPVAHLNLDRTFNHLFGPEIKKAEALKAEQDKQRREQAKERAKERAKQKEQEQKKEEQKKSDGKKQPPAKAEGGKSVDKNGNEKKPDDAGKKKADNVNRAPVRMRVQNINRLPIQIRGNPDQAIPLPIKKRPVPEPPINKKSSKQEESKKESDK